MESAPRIQRAQRLPAVAPFLMCIYKAGACDCGRAVLVARQLSNTHGQVSDNAGDMWSNYEGSEAKLYQIQMTHDARPSALFNARDSFNDFLEEMAQGGDSGYPASLELLQSTAGVKLTLTDRNDPDDVGFVQWRWLGLCVNARFVQMLP